MPQKPQKRLVTTAQYVERLAEKGGLYTFALFFAGGATICLSVTLVLLWLGLPPWGKDPDELDRIMMFLVGGFSGILCVGTAWMALKLFKAANKMEPVTRITRHNTAHLPAVETLVRGSHCPSTSLQAELVRPACEGPVTPPEQLLRPARDTESNR
jgi:hypothetical protein